MELLCPRCPSSPLTAGPFHECRKCSGTWLEERSLAEHAGTRPIDAHWSIVRTRVRLSCAQCRRAMDALDVLDVAVDRCRAHGVWFDAGELRAVASRAKGTTPTTDIVRVAPSPGDELASVVVLDTAVEGTIVAAQVVAEAASSGIFEGVLDVIGGIFSAIDF